MKSNGFVATMANIDLRTDQTQPDVVTTDQLLFMRTLAMFLHVAGENPAMGLQGATKIYFGVSCDMAWRLYSHV